MYIRFAKLDNYEIAYQSTKAQLVADKGNVNATDKQGNNALYYALKAKNYDLVELLLENNAQLISNNKQQNLLMYAIDKGNDQLFDIALKDYVSKRDISDFKVWNNEGVKAFKEVCKLGDIEKIKAINKVGIQFNASDIQREMIDVSITSSYHIEVIKFLSELSSMSDNSLESNQPQAPFLSSSNEVTDSYSYRV